MKLSPSILCSYLFCKRGLFLKNVLKVIPPQKEVMARGKILHELQEKIFQRERFVVEKIFEKKDSEEIKNMLRKEYQTILTSIIVKNRPEIDRYNLLVNILKSGRAIIETVIGERAKIISDTVNINDVFGEDLWLEIFPKIKAEVSIKSEELGLRGRIDRIEVYPDKMMPVELKSGRAPPEGIWPSHKAQISSYLLMMNESFGDRINQGKVIYIDENVTRSIFITPMLKDELKELISKVKQILESPAIPDFCSNKKKCEKCGLRNFCYDEKFINEKIKQKLGDI